MQFSHVIESLEDRTHLAAHAADRAWLRLAAARSRMILLDANPPIVQDVRINDGAAQRSNVRRIDLTFSEATNIPSLISGGTIQNAIRLYDKSAASAPVAWLTSNRFQWDAATKRLRIDLTNDGFGGNETGNLANGRYELRLDVSSIADLSGNRIIDADGRSDGQLTIDRSSNATRQDLFRFSGDLDGDADVDLGDLGILATAYQTNSGGDCDGDGDTDLSDLGALSSHYGDELPIVYGPAIVITRGGTYAGEWESLDPTISPVIIRTSDPVLIEHSTIQGKDDLISTDVNGVHLTVRHTRGYGLNPNVAGETTGRFVKAERFRHVAIENNHLSGTSGIYLFDYRGNRSANETIRVIANDALNVDGRRSNGHGGYLDFNKRIRVSDGLTEYGFDRVQFVQLNAVQSVPGIEIAWNHVINEPGNSRVEDNVSIYRSSGTANSPMAIHDNYIQGAYTIKPWQNDDADATWSYDWDYSGGGIMLGDGGDSAFAVAYNNQVISTTNYGIAIYGGHDMTIRNNRVISSGLLSDSRPIAHQNVGIYIWDADDSGPANFYDNNASDNEVGWINNQGQRNDWWIPDATSFTNNVHWPGELSLDTEAFEQTVWRLKLSEEEIEVGPMP